MAVPFGYPTDESHARHLLVRRHPRSGELAYYFCCTPPGTNARDLAVAAGQRWADEWCFEAAKQETNTDEYEVCYCLLFYR